MQYTGTSEEFTARFHNYRCAHRNYRKKKQKKHGSQTRVTSKVTEK